ncbi:sensor histidine kinase [Segeticoccus rhizosphaerae]|jgi:signal transduction histidine kinase|uniref:sensor histidine kinase n=1 Tax=Segeticoccus rhizosphaerae TaxID=1104777 RepID=UPI00126589CE|nr:histidine kinase [Segeticoccus rhizosphaerae]
MGRRSRASWAFDVAVALVAFALGQIEVWDGAGSTHRQGPHWAQALTYAITALLLVGRRWRPLETLAVIVVVYLAAFTTFGSPEGNAVGTMPAIAAYSVGRWERRYPSVWGLAALAVFTAGWIGFDPLVTSWTMRGESLFWGLQPMVAWLVGALIRSRMQVREQRRLREQDVSARAVSEERNRIARELHDVIGHNVSVMTVQAAAVRRRLTPDQVVEREALGTVETVGREALAEMRRMVAILRAEGQVVELTPAPGLAEVDQLITRFQRAGLPVRLTVTGSARPVAPGLDLTAYRVVQEGLTNVLRHADGPQRAEVLISYGPDVLELAVRDDGRPSRRQVTPGHGLIGMRERVGVYGGRLVAGVQSDGGFELHATLPLEMS